MEAQKIKGITLALACLTGVVSPPTYATSRYAATLANVIDAVTYVVDVHMDGDVKRIRLTLSGVEGPKLYGRRCERDAALFAKDLARSILQPEERLIISDLHRENSQFVGQIEFDGRSLGRVLLGFNQVRPQGKSGNWCSATVGQFDLG